MSSVETIRDQTLKLRATIKKAFEGLEQHAGDIPATWNNNAHWHLGHLIVTPRLITYGLLQEDLGEFQSYRAFFGKGTSPNDWQPGTEVPTYSELLEKFLPSTESVFDDLVKRADQAYPEAYTTTPGVVLSCPAESLSFSMAHDGMHLGMLLALKRSIAG